MLEKEVHKYTRGGVQSQNLTTGEKNMATVSDFGKQNRYFNPSQTHYKDALKRNHKSQSFRPNLSNFSTQEPDKIDDNPSFMVVDHVRSSSKFTYAIAKNTTTLAKKMHTHSINKKIRHSKSAIKGVINAQKVLHSTLRGSGKLALGSVNRTIDEGGKEGELGVSAVAKTLKGTRDTYRNTKTSYKVAKSTGKAVVNTTKAVIKAAVHVVKLLLSPVALKGILIAGAILLAVVLLQSLFGALFGAISGSTSSDNASPELNAYVLQLDKNFKQEVSVKGKELIDSSKYDSVAVMGIEAVNTSPGDILVLLSALNDFDTELTVSTRQLIMGYHKTLNTYTVEEVESVIVDDDGNRSTILQAIIMVESYSAEQKILSFNPTEEQKEIMLVFFELNNQTSQTPKSILEWPMNGYSNISSPYGIRVDPFTGEDKGEFHPALDIPAPLNTPILAATKGTVIFAASSGSYGNLIKLSHSDGLQTWYAHCNSFAVSVGDEVSSGQHIANVGLTGRTNGAHLHFEVRIKGKHQNPQIYF